MAPNTSSQTTGYVIEKPMTNLSVGDFYTGQKIFITGITGFMGKILLEKLLWSCEGVENIYVLLRPRKGQSVEERLENLIKLPIYDRLKQRDPKIFRKVVPIEGDIAKPNFDMKEKDWKTLEQSVSIIIHAASSVRFDDPLKESILINVRGTLNVLNLAVNMKNLQVMMYVSTTYANLGKHHIEEKVYKSNIHWKDLIKMAETMDDPTVDALTKKILGDYPNTYTFTKFIAENLVQDFSNEIPCVIFRPSIVVFTAREPFPGWVDSINGPVGLVMGVLSGVIHSVYGSVDLPCDFIPCDYAINGIIVTTWYRGISQKKDCIVFNGALGEQKGIPFSFVTTKCTDMSLELPLDKTLWFPSLVFTPNRILYMLMVYLTHVIPGLIFDTFLKGKAGNLSLMRIYRKVFVASDQLSYFLLNPCKFITKNYDTIFDILSMEDKDTFYCKLVDLKNNQLVKFGLHGIRKYLVKDDMSQQAIEKARRHVKKLYILHIGLKSATLLLISFFVYRIFLFSMKLVL